jgi:hypothetical protein
MRSFLKFHVGRGELVLNDFEDGFAGEQTAGAFDQGQFQTPVSGIAEPNATAATSSDLVTSAVSDAAVSDPSATPVPASSPLHYFIKLDGVQGDAPSMAPRAGSRSMASTGE